MTNNKKKILLTLPLELYQTIVKLAKEEERSIAGMVRRLLNLEVSRK